MGTTTRQSTSLRSILGLPIEDVMQKTVREISQGSEFVVTVCPLDPFHCTCRLTKIIAGDEKCGDIIQ